MLITSFKINHKKLKPGIYLHEVKKIKNFFVTTFDLRFKKPNKGDYLSNSAMHSLEHLIATFYTQNYPEKIYFGPMGCQTGFYLVVGGKKDIKWLEKSLEKLDNFIQKCKKIPGQNPMSCGNYKTLNLSLAKTDWAKWYESKKQWSNKY
ncbi:MAG: S-ribosylhomocysteine lyase [Mycoplasma sp.]|nr:S-ribosylhomocysteine lyase [Candidatus Hennigella equi]